MKASTFDGFDIMSAYLPEGIYIPSLLGTVTRKNNFEIMLGFAYLILNLYVPKKKNVGNDMRTFVAFYDYVLEKIGGVSTSFHRSIILAHI